MENDEITDKILELRNQGLSIRKIAEELEISKSNVHRIVSGHDGTEELDSVPVSQNTCPTNTKEALQTNIYRYMDYDQIEAQKEIELRKLELEHEREMKKLDLQQEELEIRNQEILMQDSNTIIEKEKQEQEQRLVTWEIHEFFEEEYYEMTNVGKIIYSFEEAESRLDAAKMLQKKLKKHCVKYNIEFQSLQYYKLLQIIYDNLYEAINSVYSNEDFDEDEKDEWTVNYTLKYSERTLLKELIDGD